MRCIFSTIIFFIGLPAFAGNFEDGSDFLRWTFPFTKWVACDEARVNECDSIGETACKQAGGEFLSATASLCEKYTTPYDAFTGYYASCDINCVDPERPFLAQSPVNPVVPKVQSYEEVCSPNYGFEPNVGQAFLLFNTRNCSGNSAGIAKMTTCATSDLMNYFSFSTTAECAQPNSFVPHTISCNSWCKGEGYDSGICDEDGSTCFYQNNKTVEVAFCRCAKKPAPKPKSKQQRN